MNSNQNPANSTTTTANSGNTVLSFVVPDDLLEHINSLARYAAYRLDRDIKPGDLIRSCILAQFMVPQTDVTAATQRSYAVELASSRSRIGVPTSTTQPIQTVQATSGFVAANLPSQVPTTEYVDANGTARRIVYGVKPSIQALPNSVDLDEIDQIMSGPDGEFPVLADDPDEYFSPQAGPQYASPEDELLLPAGIGPKRKLKPSERLALRHAQASENWKMVGPNANHQDQQAQRQAMRPSQTPPAAPYGAVAAASAPAPTSSPSPSVASTVPGAPSAAVVAIVDGKEFNPALCRCTLGTTCPSCKTTMDPREWRDNQVHQIPIKRDNSDE